jgi:chaperonin GroEL
LEHVVKTKRSLLIVAPMDQQPYATLLANKVKGNIKVNIIDLPGFGPTKEDAVQDLAILTGATVINEELGDDLDLIELDALGEAVKSVTDAKNTTLQINEVTEEISERIADVERKIEKEQNNWIKKKLQERLSMLTGKVGILYIGADSAVELKEKKDRVDDALHATKAALAEGIVPGGGIALLNASQKIEAKDDGYKILLEAIKAPYYIILENAGYTEFPNPKEYVDNDPALEDREWEGVGIDATCGCYKSMVEHGIIDPVLVTKSALKNAISVATTIVSTDCIISNVRSLESN